MPIQSSSSKGKDFVYLYFHFYILYLNDFCIWIIVLYPNLKFHILSFLKLLISLSNNFSICCRIYTFKNDCFHVVGCYSYIYSNNSFCIFNLPCFSWTSKVIKFIMQQRKNRKLVMGKSYILTPLPKN